ncbi:MAG: hypothetical protein HPY85_14520 [Anaerolineae bacterium]|nr:hypothetical protein [Anaerolineae bacterium]
MFDDLREQLNDNSFDETQDNKTADSGSGQPSSPFLFVDDAQIDGALQEYEKLDRFEGYGIYEEEEPESKETVEEKRFLGMNAPQRFMLSLMIFFMVVILGAFCLILTGKIVPPFF